MRVTSALIATLMLSSLAVSVLATAVPNSFTVGLNSKLSSTTNLGDDEDGTLPGAGKAAIACMVVFSILMPMGLCYYGCGSKWVPKPGQRQMINGNGMPINYSMGWRRWFPLGFALISFAFKIIAMGVDSWTIVKLTDINLTERWGVLGIHSTVSIDGQPNDFNQYTNYKDFCQQFDDNDQETSYKMCNTIRASGALTLACGILSLLFSALLILVSLMALPSMASLSNKSLKMWRLCGLAYMCALGAYTYWVAGAYIDLCWQINEYEGSYEIYLSVSWWFFLIGLTMDLWLGIFLKRVVFTSLPEGVNGYAPMGVVVQGQYPAGMPAPYQGQQPYTVAAYPQQYPQQPQNNAYPQLVNQPAYSQPAQGYGAPAAYGQPVAYQPPQQQPPAYNPYSTQPQH